jgi:outer membrane protein assembly factor BamD (BamD/ComL family)
MAEEFATMAPRHVNQGANGVSMENGVLVPFISSDTARPYVLTQGKNRKPAGGKEAFHDSLEALYHYAIVESMMKKGKFENAVYVILDYLATYGTNHDRAYGDLGLCYLKIARPEKALRAYQSLVAESRDPEAVETALHKINAVRFLKLDDYSHAEQGIREYLGKYPGGTWRESELYYLIKIYLYYKKDLKAARILAKQYLADFPATCRAREITSDMAEIDRAASR